MKGDQDLPQCSVFVGMSLDGFIARANGDLDWLMGGGKGELPMGMAQSCWWSQSQRMSCGKLAP